MLVEINENFTAKDKRIITNDWNDYFTSLKRYKVLSLVNRLGPLVILVYLKMGRLSEYYTPICSVHNLCREFPTFIKSLSFETRLISREKHNDIYLQRAQELEQGAYIPLAGDISIDEILNGYKRYFASHRWGDTEYEDFVLLCALTREKERIEAALNLVYNELKTWEDWRFGGPGGFENMFKELERKAWAPDELERTAEAEIVKHKLEKMPVRKILF